MVHPASCTMGTGSFLGVKCGRGVLLTTHPLLAPRSWKNRAIPLPPLGHKRACNGVTLPLLYSDWPQERHLRIDSQRRKDFVLIPHVQSNSAKEPVWG